jgi:hypothetical protein
VFGSVPRHTNKSEQGQPMIANFTALHPYLSGLGIWIVVSVIAAGIWAMCKERDDEELYERRGVDGDTRPDEGHGGDCLIRGYGIAGSEPADALTIYPPYTPPTFTVKASKGFRRAS